MQFRQVEAVSTGSGSCRITSPTYSAVLFLSQAIAKRCGADHSQLSAAKPLLDFPRITLCVSLIG